MAYETVRDGIKAVEGNLVTEANADREMFYLINRIINNARSEGFSMDYEDAQFLDGLQPTQLNYVQGLLSNSGLGTESVNAIKREAQIASNIMENIRKFMPEKLYKSKKQREAAYKAGKEVYDIKTEIANLEASNAKKKDPVVAARIEQLKKISEAKDADFLNYLSLSEADIKAGEKYAKEQGLGIEYLSNTDYQKIDKSGASGFITEVDGKIYINRDRASQVKRFSVLTHETLHPLISRQFQNKTVSEIQKELGLSKEEATGYKETLNLEAERLADEFMDQMTPKEREAVQERLDGSYRYITEAEAKQGLKDGSYIETDFVDVNNIVDGKVELKKHMYADEVLTSLKDAITDGEVEVNMETMKNMAGPLKNILNRYIPQGNFESGAEVYKFITEYALMAKEGKVSGKAINLAKNSDGIAQAASYSMDRNTLSEKAREFKALEEEGIYNDDMYVDMLKSRSTSDIDKAAAIELLIENNFGNIKTNGFRGRIITNAENHPRR